MLPRKNTDWIKKYPAMMNPVFGSVSISVTALGVIATRSRSATNIAIRYATMNSGTATIHRHANFSKVDAGVMSAAMRPARLSISLKLTDAHTAPPPKRVT